MIQEFGRSRVFYVKCPCMKDSGYHVDFIAIMDIFNRQWNLWTHSDTMCGGPKT